MTKQTHIEIAVLAISLFLSGTKLHAACTKAEWERLLSDRYFTLYPWTTINNRPDIPKACKTTSYDRLFSLLDTQATQGLCPSAICQNIDKTLKALNSKQFQKANLWTAKVFSKELDIIEEKLAAGMIPHCLLPKGCETTGPKCRQILLRELLENEAINQSSDLEQHLRVGSFLHLLLADAFTCGSGKQKGGTCTIYSGVSLMAHYCATPARNPDAWNSCTPEGPGFQCIAPDKLLEEAFASGAWQSKLCWDDPATGQSKCKPAVDNPYYDEEEDRLEANYKQNCTPENLKDKDALYYCDQIQAQLESIRKTAAIVAPGDKRYPEARLMYKPGVAVGALGDIYKRYGFSVILYEVSEDGWTKILKSLEEGHPVQGAFTTEGWPTYTSDPKNPVFHAVILEGKWTDSKGVTRILFRDSNNPDEVKIMPALKLKTAFLKIAGGGLGLRP